MIFTRTNSKEHGLAAIEMMVILPILLLLLCAIFEVGRIFMHYTMLNKALQNGARYAVIDVYGTDRASLIADNSEIKNMVVFGNKTGTSNNQNMESILPGLSASNISVDDSSANYVTVSANYAYAPIFTSVPIIGGVFSLNMNASSIMRVSP
ncbi:MULTISPECIES: TadE/TadG family type IV pilus assembly protein [Vibrio]|uniref:TadE-like domain-containing protein n=2 Tax=Vibrio TaxID=662 RepID=U3B6F0_9VIBR|nr:MULTISPECIES: TadE/TadG family type IV pilus assembly protein [Vibrio]MPW37806.1 pilus assembly protein [Vibrio sp. B1Z05]GAD81002.1 hypothetical protein VEZ01S_47_00220 [Vibrio ezurae NBRC 102218]GAD90397.1 hypothetical protein VHA01S_042_00230 [Vibrio halioticoli NBRC 102217]